MEKICRNLDLFNPVSNIVFMIPPPRFKSAGQPQPVPNVALKTKTAEFAPRARVWGSFFFLAGAFFTVITLRGNQPSEIAHWAAIGIGLSLLASILTDLKDGFINLIRPDLMAILALYFLTFFEFLSKQELFNSMADIDYTHKGIIACVVAFCGIIVGRHLPNIRTHPLKQVFSTPIPGSLLIFVFVAFIFIGSLHMLLAVNFNLYLIFDNLIGPRFAQPWGRDRFGDWKALLVELSMLFYLIPPIAGIVIARRRKYSAIQLTIIGIGLVMVLFYGFSGGTRNVFISYIVTFLIAYAFALPQERKKELILLSVACAILVLGSTVVMLQFRDFGLKTYVNGGYQYYIDNAETQSFSVDYNLAAVSKLIQVFPNEHHYLGWEVPYLAIIRPIPRAMWPGKPEGMSLTIEEALGVDGMTISTTFVGEAYMCGGIIVVFICGLIFGFLTGLWGLFSSPQNSELGILIYSSGFFSAVISMRSLYVFTTALLPTVISIIAGIILVRMLKPKYKRTGMVAPPKRKP